MTDAPAVETGFVDVPGAAIYWESRGTGPTLLMLQGGEGDADGARDLGDLLARTFRVVTHDRRGLSRSSTRGAVEIGTHADDALAVLDAVDPSGEPAIVFGMSLGGVIGLELLCRRQARVKLAIAHESPAVQFLPDEARRAAMESLRAVHAAYESDGLLSAMMEFVTLTSLSMGDREREVKLPKPSAQRTANVEHFFSQDLPATLRFTLDAQKLEALRGKIAVAVGRPVEQNLPRDCALATASALGIDPVVFPGAHNGFITHPRAFAEVLVRLIQRP